MYSYDNPVIVCGCSERGKDHEAPKGRGQQLADTISAQRRFAASLHPSMTSMALCLCLGLLGTGCAPRLATQADDAALMPSPMHNASYSEDADVLFVMEPRTALVEGSRQVNFESESASRRTRDMADWVVNSRDNLGMPFAIVDKVNAKAYVFAADGRLQGAAPVLLGLEQGDYTAPGVGQLAMSRISPAQRTTPAGRFVAAIGRNAHGKDVLWVDYEHAISMHPVIKGRPEERRAQRLESPSPLDHRISYGCINVPVAFFNNLIYKNFSGKTGVVYILPEARRGGAS